jgi:VanZ family protein
MPPLHEEDKWAHIVFYAVLTFLIARARSRQLAMQKRVWGNFIVAFLIAAIYGAIIEVIQLYFISGRHGDLEDLAANLIGGLVALPFHWLLNVKRQ